MRLWLPLLLASCAPTPWLIQRHCTPPDPLPPFEMTRCSDLGIPYAACLYEYQEKGVACVEQIERERCDSEWDEAAHYCGVYSPSEPKAWNGEAN